MGSAWVGALVIFLVATSATNTVAASRKHKSQPQATVPELLLDNGSRKLTFERSVSAEAETRKRGFWHRLVDVVAGEPELHVLVRPYGVVEDSRGRVIVSDPGANGVHIFDLAQQKYKFISRREGKESLHQPQCIAVDADDNLYVTDSDSGKVFVFNRDGTFQRALGSLKGGEGLFKRPTGVAVDSSAGRIYITDTLRDKIFVLDMSGSVLQTIGERGDAKGQFNFPTELRLNGDELLVVDAMNFRIQAFDRSGKFKFAIGHEGDRFGEFFRPKGIAVDSEGHIYIADGFYNVVQVYDRDGQLLYYFGQKGSGFGDFQSPAGVFIDHNDRVFVVDSYNGRVQIFHYFALKKAAQEEKR